MSIRENAKIKLKFGEVYNISGSWYELGYNEGKAEGHKTGFENGYTEGKAEGIEQGKQAEQDSFWETLQQGGNLKNYNYLFYQNRFDDTIYNPKYPITLGVTATSGNQAVFNSNTLLTDTKVPIIAEGVYLNQVFAYSGIKTIRELRVNENTTYNNVFSGQTALEELTITGTIGKNGFNVSACTKLTLASLRTIINALKDYYGDTSGTSWVCTLGTANLDKLTPTDLLHAGEKGWTLA